MTTMLAAPPLGMTDEQRAELERWPGRRRCRTARCVQAKALLLAADGVANYEIARRLDVASNSVRSLAAAVRGEGSGRGRARSPRAGAGRRGCPRAPWPRSCTTR